MKKNLLSSLGLLTTVVFTQAQVVQLNNNNSLNVRAPIGSKAIYISAKDNLLWSTDGTPAGTIPLGNAVTFDDDGGYAVLNNKLIFSGSTPGGGTELWITDGTVAGTVLLKNIYDGPTSSMPSGFALLNNKLYFTAETAAEGRELWMTDGTTGGTSLVKDIWVGPNSSNTIAGYDVDVSNGVMYFSANDGTTGVELWKSDGTPGGTVIVKNLDGIAGHSNPKQFFTYGAITLFTASPLGDNELWRTDGTPAGTYLIKNINPLIGSNPSGFLLFKNKVFFSADGTGFGDNAEPWVTDGTTPGTTLLKDINPVAGSFPMISSAIVYPDKFIFPAMDEEHGFELWQSDGTTGGTVLFKDIYPGEESSTAFPLPPIDFTTGTKNLFQGDKFFFIATTENEGRELWISNGTTDGTHIVKDIMTGNGDGVEDFSFLQTSNLLYFVANNGSNGSELWKTNGSEAGTMGVADINPGDGSSNPRISAVLGNKLLVEASDDGDEVNTDLYRLEEDLILPIRLLSFSGAKEGNQIRLQWKASTTNTARFEVEKSFDGKLYTSFASVTAIENSAAKDYQTVDTDARLSNSATVYYRLKVVGTDGAISYSPIVTFKQQWSGSFAKLAKNPVKDAVELNITQAGSLHYELVGINGVILKTGSFNGSGYLSIDVKNIPAGIYHLKLVGKNASQSLKLLKQ
jgi:ELWxxDGT repeat protein